MSTYINVNNPQKNPTYDDAPTLVKEYIICLQSIQNRSARTVNGYYIDLRTFFRFLKQYRKLVSSDLPLDKITFDDVSEDLIKSVTRLDIYEFLNYATNTLLNKSSSRARKASSIRGFYRYLKTNGYVKDDPTQDVVTPINKVRLPKYLTLDESMHLLESVNSDFIERDYCIFTLFLNCGMRLSELVGINVTDYKEKNIHILGKGNKERLVYINDACKIALNRYLKERAKLQNIKAGENNAMFVSKRTGKRLSPRRVQQIISAGLKSAGLDGMGFSTHKLRHTAATLMYRFGNVDMLALKEILGHEHVSTTEIYTHISVEQLQNAVESSPLAKVDLQKKKP